MAKYLLLKNSDKDAVIKVISDGDGTVEVPLSALVSDNQEMPKEGKPFVSIREVEWSGEEGGLIRVLRGGERVMSLQSAPQGLMQFEGQQMPAETHNAEEDFSFEITGTCEAWFWVRKRGYATKVEEASYGAYDDPDRVGPKEDVPVDPDYTK